MGYPESVYRRYVVGEVPYSVKFLIDFCEQSDAAHLLDEIYHENGLAFTAKKERVILPKSVTPSLAYFVGYLLGDGYLCTDGKRIEFIDEDQCQLEQISSLAENLFGFPGILRARPNPPSTNNIFLLTLSRIAIHSFLNLVLGIQPGTKINLGIPPLVKGNRELLRWFPRGVFDADGTLPKNPEKAKQLFIDIALKDLNFIIEIREALETFGVKTLEPYPRKSLSPATGKSCVTWELRIRRKGEISEFLHEIGFIHPKKMERQARTIAFIGPVAQPG